MNDMELYSAIEAVVNFDLESDPDMIAAESAIETIDYAMESAQLEYDLTGDDRFETVIEASLKKKILSEDNWFGKLVAAIKKFIRNALISIRAALNRIANAIRQRKAKAMQKDLKTASKSKLDHSVNVSKSIKDFLDDNLAFANKGMNGIVEDTIKACVERARKDGTIDKKYAEMFFKSKGGVKEKKKLSDKEKVTIDIKTVKSYMDVTVKMLNSLDKSFPSVKKVIDKYKALPQERTYVRVGTNFAYNMATATIKDYYTAAMSVARIATGGGSDGEYAAQYKAGKDVKIKGKVVAPGYKPGENS